MLRTLFYNRNFLLNPFQPALKVEAASWSVEGGPDSARLVADPSAPGEASSRLNLAQALALLRCPVELLDASGLAAWWGYVYSVDLQDGETHIRADFERMANRVKVRYETLPLESNQWAAQQLETDWLDNLESQSIYGVKEQVIRIQGSTAAQAAAVRSLALNENAWPQAKPATSRRDAISCVSAGRLATQDARYCVSTEMVVTLELKGWWSTLAWRSYAQPGGLVEDLYEGPGAQAVGSSTSDANIYQGFTLTGGDLRVNLAWLKASLVGSPSDSLQLDICSDSGGSPGASQASGTLSHTEFTPAFAWHCFEFTSAATLAPGCYWLWVHRTGATSGSHHYRLKVDEFASYPGGECRVNSSPRNPAADLLFRVCGGAETTAQIGDVVEACGQFLNGARIDSASGVYTGPYRAGDATALQEIVAHLKAGTSAAVPLQAEVTQDRYLRVYEQPQPATAVLYIGRDGLLADAAGKALPAWTPAAGRWAIQRGGWGELGSPYQQVKDRVLLERVEYDPCSGGLRPSV